MSCGKPHSTPCREVLENLYLYIDHEIDLDGFERIRIHLEECSPCLAEHEIDVLVKKLVCRCAPEPAPEQLRQKILARLRQRIDEVS